MTMEKNNKIIENEIIKENLYLDNRKLLKLEGISEIITSSETLLNIKLKDTHLQITGINMHIIKLDINAGIIEVEGLIDNIKYGKNVNFFRRLFK